MTKYFSTKLPEESIYYLTAWKVYSIIPKYTSYISDSFFTAHVKLSRVPVSYPGQHVETIGENEPDASHELCQIPRRCEKQHGKHNHL